MEVSMQVYGTELTGIRWWAIMMRGIAAVLFGVVAVARPGISLALLVVLFAVYALVDGVFAIVAALRHDGGKPWWALVLEGLVGIGAALIAFSLPGLTALALLYLIAVWAMATGIAELFAAVWLRRVFDGEWLLVLSGILSVVFGVLLATRPVAGLLTVVWLIGAYAIAFGVLLIGLSVRVRSRGGEVVAAADSRRAA
jgi:uncharacterized membrane protein HdeD (DUF308 family)